MNAFEKLKEAYGEVHDLRMASAVLAWDQQVYMPPRGAEARGHQLSTLAGLMHERLVGDTLGGLLEQCAADDSLDVDARAFVTELQWRRDRAAKLPASLVREMSLAEARGFNAWQQARKDANFKGFAPELKRLLDLSRERARCFGFEDTPWDALVQDFERGMTASRVRQFFAPLREATVDLLHAIGQRPQVRTNFLERHTNVDDQRAFALRVARDIGYDLRAGRLDIAAHPFCTNFSIHDVRITTRYQANRPLEAISGVIHEAGHALFEQGFRTTDERTPLADAPSLGLHESQSRFWEVRVAHSRPFWEYYHPIISQYLPGTFDDATSEEFYRGVNRVQPGFIRVESDEVTYNLHVIIRFELEVRLLEGSLEVADLPAEWNRLYKENLGLDVPNDALGCLQDVHWSGGMFGYFPSYTFGNMYAAMLVEKMEADLPEMWGMIGEGRFGTVLDWLRVNIHREGCRLNSQDLVELVSGKPASAEALIRYLREKYGEIYAL